MKIYTKKGDQGETGLFRGGRVDKDSIRVSAYGTVDELNCHIGWVRTSGLNTRVENLLDRVQNDLFVVGADLAAPIDAVEEGDKVTRLQSESQVFMELAIDEMEAELEPLRQFIIPGGTSHSAGLHIARAICRRAERAVVKLARAESVNKAILVYLNRLSDMLFVMARYQNKTAGVSDINWRK